MNEKVIEDYLALLEEFVSLGMTHSVESPEMQLIEGKMDKLWYDLGEEEIKAIWKRAPTMIEKAARRTGDDHEDSP
jgi:hypothetical protein